MITVRSPKVKVPEMPDAAVANLIASLDAARAAFAAKLALLAVSSAAAEFFDAIAAKSYAAFTALGVAACVVELLLMLAFSWTMPSATVEALRIEITCGMGPVILTAPVACSGTYFTPLVA